MYAMTIDEHERWSAVSSPTVRFWLKAWLDGLRAGTHVHWKLSPIARLTLAYLWRFFDRLEDGHVRDQRESIMRLAHRLTGDVGVEGELPPVDRDDPQAWAEFFDAQIEARSEIRDRVFRHALEVLHAEASVNSTFEAMNSLLAVLSLDGYTTDRLFRAIAIRVIHPGDRTLGSSCRARLEGLLEAWRSVSPSTYLAWTPLLHPPGSSSLLKTRWAASPIESVDRIDREGTFAVRLGAGDAAEPFVVSRLRCVGGVGERHRRAARRLLSTRAHTDLQLSCFTLPERSFFKLAKPGAVTRECDTGFGRAGLEVGRPPDHACAEVWRRGARDLFDAPEEAIRSLMVGAELRWRHENVAHVDQLLADSYRWNLHRSLKQEVAGFMAQARSIGVERGVDDDPRSRTAGTWPDGGDLRHLLEEVRREGAARDAGFELRLEELIEWRHGSDSHGPCLSGRPCTFHSIDDYVSLFRGIRSSPVHAEEPPFELYGAILYLAKLCFRAFTAACLREA